MKAKVFAPGFYRVSDGVVFGQIRKVGREWHAEIRRSETGAQIRLAGVWNTLTEATEECLSLMPHEKSIIEAWVR